MEQYIARRRLSANQAAKTRKLEGCQRHRRGVRSGFKSEGKARTAFATHYEGRREEKRVMRAVFIDADDALAAITEKLRRAGDPPVVIHRNPHVKSDELP